MINQGKGNPWFLVALTHNHVAHGLSSEKALLSVENFVALRKEIRYSRFNVQFSNCISSSLYVIFLSRSPSSPPHILPSFRDTTHAWIDGSCFRVEKLSSRLGVQFPQSEFRDLSEEGFSAQGPGMWGLSPAYHRP